MKPTPPTYPQLESGKAIVKAHSQGDMLSSSRTAAQWRQLGPELGCGNWSDSRRRTLMGPRRGVLKTAMERYLYTRSRTADDLLGTEEVEEVRRRKRLPALGPNRLRDMPLGAKLPLLPGSSTLFCSTHLGKQLYQSSGGFDLGDPFCQIMATKYTSLHNPHLHSYYKYTDSLRRFKRGSCITSENKKTLSQHMTKKQESSLLPEGGDTCHFGDWLLQEENQDLQDQEGQMRNRRDLGMINKELDHIKNTGEESHHLQWAEEEKKQQGRNKKKQRNLRKKMEEAWRKKEMLLLLKIGDDVKQETRSEHLRRKSRQEKAKKKQAKLEKKMALHMRKLQEDGYQSEETENHEKGHGANAFNQPSVNRKKILFSSMVSQQPFDQVTNNVMNKKRACFQKNKTEDLNSKIQNIMTWFLAEVTSILYPAVTKYEEQIRAKTHTIAEDLIFSSENSNSCYEENADVFGSLPSSKTKKVIFTDTRVKPTSSPTDHATGGKPSPLWSQKPPVTSLTKNAQVHLESEFRKENIHKEKPAAAPQLQTGNISSLHRDVVSMGARPTFPRKNFKTEKFPFRQSYFKLESTTKGANPKKRLIGEDYSSALNQSLPKKSIFQKLFELQRGTEANVIDNLKMLQVAETVVRDVFMRVKDLDQSVCILKKAPIELSERLFCSNFKRTESAGLFHKDLQKEIGLVAKEIVATVLDNFQKCLLSSISTASDSTNSVSKLEKNRVRKSELPVYDPHFSLTSIDKIAKETVESVIFTLESFVAFQFKHDFKCKFSEIVKLPVENRSCAQHKPFLRPLSTQVANEIELSFDHKMPGITSKRLLPTLEPFHNFSDVSRISSMITRESIQSAISQVQRLHSELSIYAKIAVTKILEIIKWKPEKEISQRETSPFSDISEENIMASQITGVILEQCSQNLMEVTPETKFGNLHVEKPARAFGDNKIPGHSVTLSEGMKMPTKKWKVDLKEAFPPINVPGMVIHSEEKTEMEKEIPSNLPTVSCSQFSAQHAHATSERIRKSIFYTTAPKPRASRPALETITKQRTLSSRMTLPPIGRQFSRKSFCKVSIKKSPKGEAIHRLVCEEDGALMPTCETEDQPAQSQDGVNAAAFLKKMCTELISKLITSSQNVYTQDRKTAGTNSSHGMGNANDSMLNELSDSQVKELSPWEGQVSPPQVGTLAAKIIHSSLYDILKEHGSKASDYTDIKSDKSASVETIRREIIDYQLQGPLTKASSSTIFKPLEPGLIAEEVLQEANKISTQSQSSTPHPIKVSHGFLEGVITKLLSKILPECSNTSSSAEKENEIAEFDFIHMKLVSKVMTEIAKNQSLIIQYVKCLHQNDAAMIETVVESVYNKLLPQFGSQLTIQKCVKSGCTILSEAITDLVLREVSGTQLQTFFSGELTPHQCAEADNVVEDVLRDLSEPSDHTSPVTSDIGELSSLVIEELSAKLLGKLLSIFPMVHLDAQNVSSVTDITSKIMNYLQVFLSKNQMKIHENISEPDSLQGDSKASGDLVSPLYMRILKPSNSDISIQDDLTSKNEVLANRISSVMIRDASKHEFQPISEGEPPTSSPLMLEAVNVVKKILTNMGMTKIQKQPLALPIPVLPVTFVEEILSRFLSKILTSTDSTNPGQRSLSKTQVTEVAGKLKQSMENLMSINKLSLVEAAGDTANPEYNETLNQVAHAIYNNVLQKSGSQQDFYNDITSSQTNLPQQVASIIINEISNCHLDIAFKDNPPMESQSAIALDRIVERVRAQVSLNSLPESKYSREPIGNEDANEQPTETMLPIKIIPHFGNKVLQIDPDIISKHLAVISIKTEPLEELKKACLAQTGLSLTDLRRMSVTGKSPVDETSEAEGEKKKERRPSLDVLGRLDVQPKEPATRNSFWDILKPDIAKVELLKDVENQEDLIMRLLAHDIKAKVLQQEEEEEEAALEKILKVESSSIFESQQPPDTDGKKDSTAGREDSPLEVQQCESEASLPEIRPSTSNQKKFLSLSKCCQALSNSIPEDIEDIVREIKDDQDNLRLSPSVNTQNSVTAFPSAGKKAQHESEKDTTSTHRPLPALEQHVLSSALHTEESSMLKEDSKQFSETEETSAFLAAPDKGMYVNMHQARDTEDTSEIVEFVSPYEDVGNKDSPLPQKTRVAAAVSNSSVPRQRSSLFKKVPSALARVFSRSSSINSPNVTPPDHEKA